MIRTTTMREKKTPEAPGSSFHLDKWFLDFTGENGTAMIFYAARLTWHGWSVSYTSWLQYEPDSGVRLKSRFRNVQMPQINGNTLTWADAKSGVSGTWTSRAEMIGTRVFDAEEGCLDWRCFQPASNVRLTINGAVLEGRGYAEQLILTVPPWKIPMDELRWGRFGSEEYTMVWIELQEKDKRQWLWLNGERIENCIIGDDQVAMPGKDLVLHLDRAVVLESEKKIFSVVEKLIRYIPGFNKVMPLYFLMADETKWLSNGRLHQAQDETVCNGIAIHELVNFNATRP